MGGKSLFKTLLPLLKLLSDQIEDTGLITFGPHVCPMAESAWKLLLSHLPRLGFADQRICCI